MRFWGSLLLWFFVILWKKTTASVRYLRKTDTTPSGDDNDKPAAAQRQLRGSKQAEIKVIDRKNSLASFPAANTTTTITARKTTTTASNRLLQSCELDSSGSYGSLTGGELHYVSFIYQVVLSIGTTTEDFLSELLPDLERSIAQGILPGLFSCPGTTPLGPVQGISASLDDALISSVPCLGSPEPGELCASIGGKMLLFGDAMTTAEAQAIVDPLIKDYILSDALVDLGDPRIVDLLFVELVNGVFVRATEAPTDAPTEPPAISPTMAPTEKPTVSPTQVPTTEKPTLAPSLTTFDPTNMPTFAPTMHPSTLPTPNPSSFPTPNPSAFPTPNPSAFPTPYPSSPPTSKPTNLPTSKPTNPPTSAPTQSPTAAPTNLPTPAPTRPPTNPPTPQPTNPPTPPPTNPPTPLPTSGPTLSNTTTFRDGDIVVASDDSDSPAWKLLFLVSLVLMMLLLCCILACLIRRHRKKHGLSNGTGIRKARPESPRRGSGGGGANARNLRPPPASEEYSPPPGGDDESRQLNPLVAVNNNNNNGSSNELVRAGPQRAASTYSYSSNEEEEEEDGERFQDEPATPKTPLHRARSTFMINEQEPMLPGTPRSNSTQETSPKTPRSTESRKRFPTSPHSLNNGSGHRRHTPRSANRSRRRYQRQQNEDDGEGSLPGGIYGIGVPNIEEDDEEEEAGGQQQQPPPPHQERKLSLSDSRTGEDPPDSSVQSGSSGNRTKPSFHSSFKVLTRDVLQRSYDKLEYEPTETQEEEAEVDVVEEASTGLVEHGGGGGGSLVDGTSNSEGMHASERDPLIMLDSMGSIDVQSIFSKSVNSRANTNKNNSSTRLSFASTKDTTQDTKPSPESSVQGGGEEEEEEQPPLREEAEVEEEEDEESSAPLGGDSSMLRFLGEASVSVNDTDETSYVVHDIERMHASARLQTTMDDSTKRGSMASLEIEEFKRDEYESSRVVLRKDQDNRNLLDEGSSIFPNSEYDDDEEDDEEGGGSSSESSNYYEETVLTSKHDSGQKDLAIPEVPSSSSVFYEETVLSSKNDSKQHDLAIPEIPSDREIPKLDTKDVQEQVIAEGKEDVGDMEEEVVESEEDVSGEEENVEGGEEEIIDEEIIDEEEVTASEEEVVESDGEGHEDDANEIQIFPDDDDDSGDDLEQSTNDETLNESSADPGEYLPPGLGVPKIEDFLHNGSHLSSQYALSTVSEGSELGSSRNSGSTRGSEVRKLHNEVNELQKKVDEMERVKKEAERLRKEREELKRVEEEAAQLRRERDELKRADAETTRLRQERDTYFSRVRELQQEVQEKSLAASRKDKAEQEAARLRRERDQMRHAEEEAARLRQERDEMKKVEEEAVKLRQERDNYFSLVRDLQHEVQEKSRVATEKEQEDSNTMMQLLEENEKLMIEMMMLKEKQTAAEHEMTVLKSQQNTHVAQNTQVQQRHLDVAQTSQLDVSEENQQARAEPKAITPTAPDAVPQAAETSSSSVSETPSPTAIATQSPPKKATSPFIPKDISPIIPKDISPSFADEPTEVSLAESSIADEQASLSLNVADEQTIPNPAETTSFGQNVKDADEQTRPVIADDLVNSRSGFADDPDARSTPTNVPSVPIATNSTDVPVATSSADVPTATSSSDAASTASHMAESTPNPFPAETKSQSSPNAARNNASSEAEAPNPISPEPEFVPQETGKEDDSGDYDDDDLIGEVPIFQESFCSYDEETVYDPLSDDSSISQTSASPTKTARAFIGNVPLSSQLDDSSDSYDEETLPDDASVGRDLAIKESHISEEVAKKEYYEGVSYDDASFEDARSYDEETVVDYGLHTIDEEGEYESDDEESRDTISATSSLDKTSTHKTSPDRYHSIEDFNQRIDSIVETLRGGSWSDTSDPQQPESQAKEDRSANTNTVPVEKAAPPEHQTRQSDPVEEAGTAQSEDEAEIPITVEDPNETEIPVTVEDPNETDVSSTQSEVCCNVCSLECGLVGEIIMCPHCGEVPYCSSECMDWDWNKGGHNRECTKKKTKKKKKAASPPASAKPGLLQAIEKDRGGRSSLPQARLDERAGTQEKSPSPKQHDNSGTEEQAPSPEQPQTSPAIRNLWRSRYEPEHPKDGDTSEGMETRKKHDEQQFYDSDKDRSIGLGASDFAVALQPPSAESPTHEPIPPAVAAPASPRESKKSTDLDAYSFFKEFSEVSSSTSQDWEESFEQSDFDTTRTERDEELTKDSNTNLEEHFNRSFTSAKGRFLGKESVDSSGFVKATGIIHLDSDSDSETSSVGTGPFQRANYKSAAESETSSVETGPFVTNYRSTAESEASSVETGPFMANYRSAAESEASSVETGPFMANYKSGVVESVAEDRSAVSVGSEESAMFGPMPTGEGTEEVLHFGD